MNNSINEFVGQIIDIFEDFLEFKGIEIENDEKEGTEEETIIYGSDYGILQTNIETMLDNWNTEKKQMEKVVIILDKEKLHDN